MEEGEEVEKQEDRFRSVMGGEVGMQAWEKDGDTEDDTESMEGLSLSVSWMETLSERGFSWDDPALFRMSSQMEAVCLRSQYEGYPEWDSSKVIHKPELRACKASIYQLL